MNVLFYVSLLVLVTSDLTKGCYYNGVTYKPGDKYNMDRCTWCICNDDNAPLCKAAFCGMPRCKNYAPAVLKEGECCPRCPVGSEM
ncbi:unnamed protein product [Lymnaea stagnalis]|uniref:VWFC domain-containing protein n=1 Tax=Lymnaea stagnalis TaxID=6523 RepID=A0AAV2HQQ3_LYMST